MFVMMYNLQKMIKSKYLITVLLAIYVIYQSFIIISTLYLIQIIITLINLMLNIESHNYRVHT
jgi:hypothetical protein